MKSLANFFTGMAKTFASLSGREKTIVIDEHSFSIDWRKTTDTDNYSWDGNLYEKGNIFIKDKANPIKISPSEADNQDIELKSSKEYKTAMRMNLLQQAFDTRGSGLDLMEKLLIANIGVLIVGFGVLVVVLG